MNLKEIDKKIMYLRQLENKFKKFHKEKIAEYYKLKIQLLRTERKELLKNKENT